MELTNDQKQKLITKRLEQYAVRRFELELDRTALLAVNDSAGAEQVDKRIEHIDAAVGAIKQLGDDQHANT